MAPTVERILDISNTILGEGPHWDVETETLYFVNIFGKSINRYVPSTGHHTKAQLEKQLSMVVPVKGTKNKFIGALEKDIVIITWDGQSEQVTNIEKVSEIQPGIKTILNDGKCDSKGRLWIGSLDLKILEPKSEVSGSAAPDVGILISLDNGKITTHLTQVSCSNGLGWNKEETKFYYIDSTKGTVDAFDFDLEKGTISNRTQLFTLSKHDIKGIPDGMTVDADGNLWVAAYGGSGVFKIDPIKPETLLQRVELPAKNVTSVAWGGKNLDELFVTTGTFSMDEEELLPPDHGATYRITNLGTRGMPAEEFGA